MGRKKLNERGNTTQIAMITSDIAHLPEDKIKDAIASHSSFIQKYAYAFHDKGDSKKVPGDEVNPHYHVILFLDRSREYSNIASWFDIPEGRVSPVQSICGALTYLWHGNSPDKYQFSPDIVVSNFDVQERIDIENAKILKNGDGMRRLEIINNIADGTYRRFNISSFVSPFEYVKYKNIIDKAFDYRANLLKNMVDFRMDCIYLYGKSSTGKTTYAKDICVRRGLSYFISSSSNDPLDDYGGEDCIILDDLRPSSFNLADLIKFFDPNTRSTVKSRFKNKVLECSLIIITTTLTPDEFFPFLKSEIPEEYVQFFRRLKITLQFDKDLIYPQVWDSSTFSFVSLSSIPNPFYKLNFVSCSETDHINSFGNILGLSPDDLADVHVINDLPF